LVKYGKVLLPEILRLEEMKKPKSRCKNRSKAEPFSTVSENIATFVILQIPSGYRKNFGLLKVVCCWRYLYFTKKYKRQSNNIPPFTLMVKCI